MSEPHGRPSPERGSRAKRAVRRLIHVFPWVSRAVLVLVALLILVLSLAPRALFHAQDLLNDKLQHLVAYLLLGMCAMLASQRRGPASLLLAVGFCTALGGLIEILQPFVGRSRDVADLVSDLVGAVVGAAAIALASRWMRSRKRRQA